MVVVTERVQKSHSACLKDSVSKHILSQHIPTSGGTSDACWSDMFVLSDSDQVPRLPAWKGFVVQFTHETTSQTGTFSGRVEHLSSARRARFSSAEELVAVLRKMLDALGEQPEPTR